jgi:16S rRNA (uracil1498-N3)-methyltransferase
VLRTKVNTPVTLFNGDGFEYYCRTLSEDAKKTLISIESRMELNRESGLDITLIQGLSRNDRMEYSIQKSVELGVNRIIPVVCKRSSIKLSEDKKSKKLSHWQKVIISACEQSGRNRIPEITEIIPFEKVFTLLNERCMKLALNPDSDNSLSQFSDTQNNVSNDAVEIVIGPEGGLTEEETGFLQDNQFSSIRFGPRILRTETAGPAVISACQLLWGDC